MNRTAVILTVLAVAWWLGSNAGPLAAAPGEDARTAEAEGRWSEAVDLWEEIAREAASAGKANARALQEEYLRALLVAGLHDRLEEACEQTIDDYPLWDIPLILLARVYEARGEPDRGAALLDAGVAPSSGFLDGGTARTTFPAAAERARLLTVRGRRDEAAALMSAVLADYDSDAETSADELTAVGHAARARGDYHGAARAYELAYRRDPAHLDARLALAYLFQEKYQVELASDEIAPAARLAPRHPDVMLAVARLSLLNNGLPRAEAAARSVIELRPDDAGARVVLARLALIAEDPPRAKELTDEVLRANPTDRDARSMAAATAYLAGDSTSYHRQVDRVLEQDPGYLDVYLDLARILEMSRRHDEAFALYRQVLARDPDHAGALSRMGLLHMREGNEAEARVLLERGFEGDPFNIRVYNQLELLDKLDTFTTAESEHFRLRFEAGEDSLLTPLLLASLDRIYHDLTRSHGWEPEVPTVVEIFPSHDWFSARVTGMPYVEGIPAVCFGDVVAMDSPRTLAGRNNWEQILRHEYGHVLALGMTHRRVPFWFTEGLSVYLEEYPRSVRWDENLRGAYVDGALVPVDSLTIAFTRPKHFDQRLLAYHESGIIIADLVDRHGWDAIPAMLRAFGEGQGLERAVEDVTGESYDEFARHALDAVRARAEALAVWPLPDPDRLERLEARAEAGEESVEFLELLAMSRYQVGMQEQAAVAAVSLLALEPDNSRALGLAGLIENAEGRTDSARDNLERAVAAGSRDIPVHLALADVRAAGGDTTGALAQYAAALALHPGTKAAHLKRAALFRAAGDPDAARAELWLLLAQEDGAGQAALSLARLELEAGNPEQVVEALHYAVAVLPLDANVPALRGQAYLMQDRDREAYALLLRARQLDLRCVESMVGMAGYYLKQEDYEEAGYFAELALKYDPEHRRAQEILDEARAW